MSPELERLIQLQHLESAIAEGVAYVTGRPFFVDDGGSRTMRLTFAKESEANIREGVSRLARSVRGGKAS